MVKDSLESADGYLLFTLVTSACIKVWISCPYSLVGGQWVRFRLNFPNGITSALPYLNSEKKSKTILFC